MKKNKSGLGNIQELSRVEQWGRSFLVLLVSLAAFDSN